MKYSVIGAGHGGQALAGYLRLQGAEVLLFNRTQSVVENIEQYGRIEIQGCVQASVYDVTVTSDLKKAISFAEIVMICIPSHYHLDFAEKAKQYFREGQIVILNPGRTLGAYYFDRAISATEKGIMILETDTFLLTSRKITDGISKIFSFKERVFLGYNNEGIGGIVSKLRAELPMLYPADSVIYTSLSNIGAIFHPLPILLNIGRIECGEKFLHYKEGITPSVSRMLEKLDAERLLLAKGLGTDVLSAKEWICQVYRSQGTSLYEVIQDTKAYDEVVAPKKISTRYIFEDIATGIVPMYCLAERLKSPNRILGIIIDLASEMFSYDFMKAGRTDIDGFLNYVHYNVI